MQPKTFPRNHFYLDRYQTRANSPADHSYLEYSADSFEQEDVNGSLRANFHDEWSGLSSGTNGKAGRPSDDDLLSSMDSAEDESAPDRDTLKKKIQALRNELKTEITDEDRKEEISEKIEDAEDAFKKQDFETAQEELDEAKEDLKAAKAEAKATQKENEEGRATFLKDLEDKIKDSDISDKKKEALQQEIETLKTESKAKGVDAEKFKEKLVTLKEKVSKEIHIAKLKGSFTGFAAKIPTFADASLTSDLAGRITRAVDSEDWSSVLKLLGDSSVNKDNIYHAVRQMVGVMYFSLAGEDEKKLEQLLDLIPKEVRQAMYNCIMPTYKDNDHWSSNKADKQKHGLYGNGGATATRLEESWKKDDIKAETKSA